MNVSSLGCFCWPHDHEHWFAEMWNIDNAIVWKKRVNNEGKVLTVCKTGEKTEHKTYRVKSVIPLVRMKNEREMTRGCWVFNTAKVGFIREVSYCIRNCDSVVQCMALT